MANDRRGELKSTFDLAMERMAQRGEGLAKLSDGQKKRLADLSAKTKAKIAEVEILHGKALTAAREAGDAEKIAQAEEDMRREIRKLRDTEEAEKARIRAES
jgi:hypothetical protein